MYEAAVAQVYTLCRIADVHTIRSGQGEATNHYVRARIFWYAHVHEGITTGLKGGRLILCASDSQSEWGYAGLTSLPHPPTGNRRTSTRSTRRAARRATRRASCTRLARAAGTASRCVSLPRRFE